MRVFYVEYGSGGSTRMAATLAEEIISVDSNPNFLAKASQGCANVHPLYADIGIIGMYGFPIFRHRTRRRLEKWRSYVTAPWDYLGDRAGEVNFVLIDGRFRLACAFYSLLRTGPGADCQFMLDGYSERPHYHALEEFVEILEQFEVGVICRRAANFDEDRCRAVLSQCWDDFR